MDLILVSFRDRGPASSKQDEPSLENHNLSHFWLFSLEQKKTKLLSNGTKRYDLSLRVECLRNVHWRTITGLSKFLMSRVIMSVHIVQFSCNLDVQWTLNSYIHDWNFRLHKIYSKFCWNLIIFEEKIFREISKFQILEYKLETEWPSDGNEIERTFSNEHLWSSTIIKDTVRKLRN